MNVKIEYCAPCGYRKRAEVTATALKEQLELRAELIPGKGGVFCVSMNGEEIIACTRGHFPSPEEIVTVAAGRKWSDYSDLGVKSRAKRS